MKRKLGELRPLIDQGMGTFISRIEFPSLGRSLQFMSASYKHDILLTLYWATADLILANPISWYIAMFGLLRLFAARVPLWF